MKRDGWLVCAALAALFWVGLRRLPPRLFEPGAAPSVSSFTVPGEMLLHGVADPELPSANGRMPLGSVTAALLYDHGADSPAGTWKVAMAGAAFVLLAVVCFLLGSPLCALAAAAAFTGRHGWYGNYGHPATVLTLSLLTVAATLVWRAREPGRFRDLWVALAVGVSLLLRSTLVFFPPLLVAAQVLGRGRAAARRDARGLLLLLIVPYLFLVPWARMNWAVSHRLMILESEDGNAPIVAGAYGLVHGIEGDVTALIDEPIEEISAPGAVLRWAVRRVLRHPVAYAVGYARRLAWVVGLHPFLFLAAFAGVALARRDPGVRALALLVLYYLLIHCFMAVGEEYFDPFWALLCALASAPLLALWEPPRPKGGRAAVPVAKALVLGWLGLCLALTAFTVSRVDRFGARARAGSLDSDATWDAAVARAPRDARLLYMRGDRRLRQGRLPEATADLAEAARLRPEEPQYALTFAWARALQGDGAPLQAWTPANEYEELSWKGRVLQAHGLLLLHRTSEAAGRLRQAMRGSVNMNATGAAIESEAEARLRACNGDIIGVAAACVRRRPEGEVRALFAELEAAMPECPKVGNRLAELLGQQRL